MEDVESKVERREKLAKAAKTATTSPSAASELFASISPYHRSRTKFGLHFDSAPPTNPSDLTHTKDIPSDQDREHCRRRVGANLRRSKHGMFLDSMLPIVLWANLAFRSHDGPSKNLIRL